MTNLADLKVFIVDDDNYCRELLYNILLNQGFSNIQKFENGVDCMSNLSQQPDMIFLDYNMDPVNGLEVLKTAKRICPDAIFMMVSAQRDLQVVIDAIDAGASEYIVKDENVCANLSHMLGNMTKKIQSAKTTKTIKPSETNISAQHLYKLTKMKSLVDNFKNFASGKTINILGFLLLISSLIFSVNSNAQSAITWYRDYDGDGLGNPAVFEAATVKPTGYVLNNLDCNDSNANTISWSAVGGSAGISSTTAAHESMAIDGNNNPYVAYVDNNSGITVEEYSGGAWGYLGAAKFVSGNTYLSLAINSKNVPYVAYQDGYNGNVVSYNSFTNTWSTVGGTSDFTLGGATYTSLAFSKKDTAYMAFVDAYYMYSGKASVMKYNGSSWVGVGSYGFSAGSATYTSIAVDTSGYPYVVYEDGGNSSKATVMKYNGSSWAAVGSAGISAGTATYTSIAIDRSNNVFIAYEDGSNSNKVTVKKYSGGTWSTVGSVGFSAGTSTYVTIAVDAAGTPYVSYNDGGNSNKATVMKYNGSNWVNVVSAGFSGGTASYTSIALTSVGEPYIAYEDGNSSNKVTMMSTIPVFTEATTPTLTSSGTVSCGSSSVTLSVSSGTLHDASSWVWYSGSCGGTYIGTGTSINVTVGSIATFYCRGENNCFSSQGNCGSVSVTAASTTPSVWYQDYDGDGWGNPLIYENSCTPPSGYVANNEDCNDSSVNGATWYNVGSSSGINYLVNSNTGTATSIAFDNSNVPYVFFNEQSTAGSVMKYNGSAWAYLGSSKFTPGGITYGSIAVTNSDTVYVSYHDNGYKGSVMKYNGSSWVNVGSAKFTPADCSYTSLGFNSSGKPYMSFSDANVSNKATVMLYNGSTWGYVGTEGFSAGTSSYNNMAVDHSGNLYVVYEDGAHGNKATVMKYNGSSWNTVGSAGLSSGGATYTSIALDTAGHPYIVYSDSVNSYKATVMKYNGSSWSTLGSAGFSAGAATSTSIGVDFNGHPYVTYSDGGNSNKATVMKYNGSSWVTAGSAGFSSGTASATGIALDATGLPYVAFADGTTTRANVFKIAPAIPVAPTTPTLTATATTVTCGQSTTISVAGGALNGATNWHFYSSSCGVGYIGVGTSATVTPVATNTYYARAEGSCLSTPGSCGTITITRLNSSPILSVIGGSSTVCVGSTTTLTDSTSEGSWSSSNNSVATINSSGVLKGISIGTVTVTYSDTNSCGNTSVTKTITVSSGALSAGTISGTMTVCAGLTTTLSDGTSGGTWSTSNSSTATVSTGGVVSGISSGTANISYTVAGSCGSAYTYSVVTVNPLAVAGTITGTMTVCAGSATTLSDGTSGGTWSTSNSSIATVSTSGVVSGISSGTANISYSVTNSCGTAKTSSVVTVNPLPATGAISGSTNLCTSSTSTLSDGTNGGAWSTSNSGVATVSTGGIVTAISAGATNISYTVTNSCGTASVYTVVTVANLGTWEGTSDNNWNNSANWPCSMLPGSTTDVNIPSGTPYAPTISSGADSVRSLTISSGATLTISSSTSINIKSNLTNNGIITGIGSVNLIGGSSQTIAGINTVYNLQLNNSAGAIVNPGDTLKIKGTLTLAAGTLTTNNGLVLASDATGSGRIGTITNGGLNGNVTVQQYVSGGRRAYRFCAHPFSTYIPLSQIEQSVDITGLYGATNGFTSTASNASSCYWYNTHGGNSSDNDDPGWRAFTSTSGTPDTNEFKPYEGIRLFIRGSKGEGLLGETYTPSAVTISMNGPVNTGNVSETMHSCASSNYNLLGNPYPSPVDIGTVIYNAKNSGLITGAAFYVWNPYLGISGAYQTIPISGSSYYLEMNASFEVRTTADGNLLNFTESNKSSSSNSALLRAAPEYVSLQVYDASYQPWDMLYVQFNNEATNGTDSNFDAGKRSNPDLNFYSLSSNNAKLSIDARPYSAGNIIPLGFTSSYAQEYIIKAESFAVPDGEQLYLHDKYLGKYVSLEQGTEYKFTITADAASQGNNRFELGMGRYTDTVITIAATIDVQMTPNPATEKVTINYVTNGKDNSNVRIISLSGVVVVSQDLGVQQSGSANIALDKLVAGIYLVEFTSGNDKVVKRLVKE